MLTGTGIWSHASPDKIRERYVFVQQLINGLTVGAIYALLALGYSMVYGVLGLINFAHGEIYMIGAYSGILYFHLLTAIGAAGWPPVSFLLLLFLGSAVTAVGYAVFLEQVAYRPLRSARSLSPLISAIGASVFLQNYVMLTQGSADLVFPTLFPNEPLSWTTVPISGVQAMMMFTSFSLMLALHLFVTKTRLGKGIRAVAQDKTMAALCGIDVNRLIMLTFAIGAILAAGAGVMVGMYNGTVHFSIGFMVGLKAFAAAVLGGIGSLPGAMVGGILLGLVESLGSAYLVSEFKDGFAFCLLILVLIVKPTGLFGDATQRS